LLVSAGPPVGGRNEVTQRFSRRFNLLVMPDPTEMVLETIFTSILGGYFEVKGFT